MGELSIPADPFNVIITGVGGQGNVMASRTMARMLVKQGFHVTIGETFGMSQRGGSVMSHLRISAAGMWSPQIPRGRAHAVIALEPLEALRVLQTYGNPEVTVLTNTRPAPHMGNVKADLAYPEPEAMRRMLAYLSGKVWMIDATDAALQMGNPILANIVMIGAYSATGVLPLSRAVFEEVIGETFSPDKVTVNLQAFDCGISQIGAHGAAGERENAP
jgi:indolepyruvate ferredoxin oxidoreductase beta subunit